MLEKGVKVLYVKIQKVLYGIPCSELIFYLKLAIDLKNNGFVINTYDRCAAKKLVKGEAMKVVWHVDYIKVSYKYLFVVTNFAQYLSTIQGNKFKVHRGKIHDYLERDLDYSETGVVNILMIKYLQKVLDKFPEELRGTLTTLAADHLFQVIDKEETDF